MKRRFFNAGAFVSLVLFLTATTLWVRSYRVAEFWTYAPPGRQYTLDSISGVVELSLWKFAPGQRIAESGYVRRPDLAGFDLDNLWQFVFKPRTVPGLGTFVLVTVPHWLICLIAAIAPTIWLARAARRGRHDCPACGYDLRGSDSKTCPECGAATPARDPASPRA